MQPGTEALRVAQPGELAPGEEECLLDGVLCTLGIAKDPIRDREAQVAVEVDELGEGDIVTLPCPFDQPRPHVRVSSGARSGASPTTDGGTRRKVQRLEARSPVRAGTGPRSRRCGTTEAFPVSVWSPTLARMDRPTIRRASVVAAALAIAAMATPAAVAAATDSDHDGLPNTWERSLSLTSPYRSDTDHDGLPDGREDPDHDGLTNRQEYLAGMNPRRADTDRDGIRDGREDTDHDGLRTAFEFLAGTSPRRADSDGDGIRDGSESPDHDGLSNRAEQTLGTKPRVRDTDGDGWSDGAEHRAGTNPLKASSHPVAAPPPVRRHLHRRRPVTGSRSPPRPFPTRRPARSSRQRTSGTCRSTAERSHRTRRR